MSSMPLDIRRAWLIPWNAEEGTFGVAYEYLDGGSECHLVGTKTEALVVVEEIKRQITAGAGDNVIDLTIAAHQHPRG